MEEALDAAGALKLVMLKGPREGETLEYPPGSELRIGRLVRGNNFTIKDSGISTHHLTIDSHSGKWLLRDLHSSNGTIVNHTNLRPDTPLELNDGDRIKIGEYTSIEVKIDHDHSRLRRNPRRGAAATKPVSSRLTRRSKDVEADSALVEIPENCSVDCEQVKIEPKRRGGGRKRKKVPEEKDLGEIVVVDVKDDDDRGDQKYLGEIALAEVKDSGDDGEEGAVNVNVRESGNDDEEAKGLYLGCEEAAIDCKDVDENGSGCGVKESKVGQELDLEKMTLDDWFDYVQVSWPKVVVHEIDKIFDGMREKAKQVQEYIAQHQKEKVQG
ncbi:hypothetical protein M0R45_019818 [Rubus argutus]|uniref:FHA domain-containing protein n=1 Tax=Rubus argutus TaxID=59490 RepID=A0AAW1X7D1_RUBAR